mmetsp:Transcript_15969/g.43969  ORF Transcript_15969/g.43969 Transcript_15969/m.43969 type:complete len:162 (+) Transcript_15969:278-763(+)
MDSFHLVAWGSPDTVLAEVPIRSNYFHRRCLACKSSAFLDCQTLPWSDYACLFELRHKPLIPGTDFGGLRYHPMGNGIKMWFLERVGLKLPYIPVVPGVLKWTLGATGIVIILAKVFPAQASSILQPFLISIAEGLEVTAEYLKTMDATNRTETSQVHSSR